MAGLSRQSLQNAKTADWVVADASRAKPVSKPNNREFFENYRQKQAFRPVMTDPYWEFRCALRELQSPSGTFLLLRKTGN
jgi:hypothetical protein